MLYITDRQLAPLFPRPHSLLGSELRVHKVHPPGHCWLGSVMLRKATRELVGSALQDAAGLGSVPQEVGTMESHIWSRLFHLAVVCLHYLGDRLDQCYQHKKEHIPGSHGQHMDKRKGWH